MIFFFLILILLFISNIHFKKFDRDYLNINNTTIINGLFVVIVFFSHFISYNHGFNKIDLYFVKFIGKIGQLMVTTFLFYSGYGIFYKIHKNKKEYIDSFFKKRFLKLLFNFDLAVLLFYALSLIMNNKYSFLNVLLSLIGWESLGNSNWYIFVIFIMYIAIMFVFKLFKKQSNLFCLIAISLISVAYVFILNIFKDDFWCNTLLCFPAGMWYSYYKEQIDNIIFKKISNYFITLTSLIIIFILLFFINDNIFIYNIFSIIFVLIITLLLPIVSSTNKIILYFGKNVFWIYILQRIPMIIFQGKINIYLYFIICFFITIVLSYILSFITNKMYKRFNF